MRLRPLDATHRWLLRSRVGCDSPLRTDHGYKQLLLWLLALLSVIVAVKRVFAKIFFRLLRMVIIVRKLAFICM